MASNDENIDFEGEFNEAVEQKRSQQESRKGKKTTSSRKNSANLHLKTLDPGLVDKARAREIPRPYAHSPLGGSSISHSPLLLESWTNARPDSNFSNNNNQMNRPPSPPNFVLSPTSNRNQNQDSQHQNRFGGPRSMSPPPVITPITFGSESEFVERSSYSQLRSTAKKIPPLMKYVAERGSAAHHSHQQNRSNSPLLLSSAAQLHLDTYSSKPSSSSGSSGGAERGGVKGGVSERERGGVGVNPRSRRISSPSEMSTCTSISTMSPRGGDSRQSSIYLQHHNHAPSNAIWGGRATSANSGGSDASPSPVAVFPPSIEAVRISSAGHTTVNHFHANSNLNLFDNFESVPISGHQTPSGGDDIFDLHKFRHADVDGTEFHVDDDLLSAPSPVGTVSSAPAGHKITQGQSSIPLSHLAQTPTEFMPKSSHHVNSNTKNPTQISRTAMSVATRVVVKPKSAPPPFFEDSLIDPQHKEEEGQDLLAAAHSHKHREFPTEPDNPDDQDFEDFYVNSMYHDTIVVMPRGIDDIEFSKSPQQQPESSNPDRTLPKFSQPNPRFVQQYKQTVSKGMKWRQESLDSSSPMLAAQTSTARGSHSRHLQTPRLNCRPSTTRELGSQMRHMEMAPPMKINGIVLKETVETYGGIPTNKARVLVKSGAADLHPILHRVHSESATHHQSGGPSRATVERKGLEASQTKKESYLQPLLHRGRTKHSNVLI